MDLYTAFPDAVGPLPYHGMGNYPPETPLAETADYRRYRETWNTRRVVGHGAGGGTK
jgi:hypothetical protein